MKKMTENFKAILFVITLLCFTSNIFANGSKPSLRIINSEKKTFTLISDNDKNTSVIIRIFDEQGVNLLKEKVALDGRPSKAYNLSELPKGIYEVEIEDDFSFRKYIVTTTSSDLQIVENDEGKIYKPVVKLEEGFVFLNMLNLNSKDVSLTINNESGEEIYAEKIQDTQAIHKSYNLSNLPAGRYLIAVSTPAKSFNLEVNLR